MASVEKPVVRKLRLRYPGTCASCGIALSAGAEALWNRAEKTATCLACAPPEAEPEAGAAGASAAAEGERRVARSVERVRREHGDYAAAVAEKLAPEELARSWSKGSDGENRLANYVAKNVGDAVIPLHDRLVPGTRGSNIDHVYVAATGVWVVDAKAYSGKIERRDVGPFWREENQVWVKGRNRTKLVDGVERQRRAVSAAIEDDPALGGTSIHAALCFLDVEWGLLQSPFQVRGVWILYPGALRKRLLKSGPLPRETMERIAHRLHLSLPSAAT